MPASLRQQIVDAVIDRMSSIQTVNGYLTDIGANVYDWRTQFHEEELPAVSVCDLTADTITPDGASNPQRVAHSLPLQIRIYAVRDESPSNIRAMIADVITAIGRDDRWHVGGIGLAMTTRRVRDGFLIPQDSFEVIGGVVEVEVIYLTAKWNPNGFD
jgi:hypothetical protein